MVKIKHANHCTIGRLGSLICGWGSWWGFVGGWGGGGGGLKSNNPGGVCVCGGGGGGGVIVVGVFVNFRSILVDLTNDFYCPKAYLAKKVSNL